MTVDKSYTYKSNSYKMLPMNLALMHKAAPLLARYRKLHYEYTKDIDMSPLEPVKSRIEELKTAISQLEAGNSSDESRIKSLREKLIDAESGLKSNSRLANLMKLYQDSEGLAMYELITDSHIMKRLFTDILIPVNNEISRHKLCELDFDEPEIFNFIKEVITDFFSYTLQSRPK